MISIEQMEFKNYLISHNYKKYITLYTIFIIILTIFITIIAFKYKYKEVEEYISKNINNNITFEIDNKTLLKIDKYKMKIENEIVDYKIINIEQDLEKTKVTIKPEKIVCDSTYCKVTLSRKLTIENLIKEKIRGEI